MRSDLRDYLRCGKEEVIAVLYGMSSQFEADCKNLSDLLVIVNGVDYVWSRLEAFECGVGREGGLFVHQPEDWRSGIFGDRGKYGSAGLKEGGSAIDVGGGESFAGLAPDADVASLDQPSDLRGSF